MDELNEADYARWLALSEGDSKLDSVFNGQINPFTGEVDQTSRVAFKKNILVNKAVDLIRSGDELIRKKRLKAFYYIPIELDYKGTPIPGVPGVAHLSEGVKKGLYYSYEGRDPNLQDRVFRLLYKMPYGEFKSYYRVIDVNTNEEFVVAPGDLDWLREIRVYGG